MTIISEFETVPLFQVGPNSHIPQHSKQKIPVLYTTLVGVLIV
jgi:hypothetical protein